MAAKKPKTDGGNQGQAGFFDEEITGHAQLTNAIKTWEAERKRTEPLRARFAKANTAFQAQLGSETEAYKVVEDLIVRRHGRDIVSATKLDDVPHRYRAGGWIFEVTDDVGVEVAPFIDQSDAGRPGGDGPPAPKTPGTAKQALDELNEEAKELQRKRAAKKKPAKKPAKKAAKKTAKKRARKS